MCDRGETRVPVLGILLLDFGHFPGQVSPNSEILTRKL